MLGTSNTQITPDANCHMCPDSRAASPSMTCLLVTMGWLHFDHLHCRQLIQDQLPERKGQLYNTYGPGGVVPLIPEAQAASPPLSIQTVDTTDGTGQYVQIFNGNSVAVDVSGYKLQGSTSMTLAPGESNARSCQRQGM